MDEQSVVDPLDFKRLLEAILRQGMDDYIKLQHPRARVKKYMEEAFLEAADMLFDPTYQFLHLKNEMGDEMHLQDVLEVILGIENLSPKDLQEKVIDMSKEFWMKKQLQVIKIPECVVLDGHVYSVFNDQDVEGHYIDLANKTIFLDKNSEDSTNQEEFCKMLVELACHHEELKMRAVDLDRLGRCVFRLLRMNDCFTGTGEK